MTILEIFEKVNLVTPIEQRRFFNYYEDSVNELLSMYGDIVLNAAVVDEKGNFSLPENLSDEGVVLPLYNNAIVDNILFLAGQGEAYKSEFIRKAQATYLKYWNDNAKGKRVKRGKW